MLDYNADTGEFTWRVRLGQRKPVGSSAGCLWRGRTCTYWYIGIDRKVYYAHRLAFLWMTGKWPTGLVDHKDNDGTNNRWTNLREATVSQNLGNSRRRADNRSGFKGVCLYGDRFHAQCGKTYLGDFDTPQRAHAAYVRAARKQFGEFARAG